jgi:hypothetical protein
MDNGSTDGPCRLSVDPLLINRPYMQAWGTENWLMEVKKNSSVVATFVYGSRAGNLCDGGALVFVHEQYGQSWAEELAKLLVEIKNSIEIAQQQGQIVLTSAQLADFEARYDQRLAAGYRANPPPAEPVPKKRGRKKQSKPQDLLDRRSSARSAAISRLPGRMDSRCWMLCAWRCSVPHSTLLYFHLSRAQMAGSYKTNQQGQVANLHDLRYNAGSQPRDLRGRVRRAAPSPDRR